MGRCALCQGPAAHHSPSQVAPYAAPGQHPGAPMSWTVATPQVAQGPLWPQPRQTPWCSGVPLAPCAPTLQSLWRLVPTADWAWGGEDAVSTVPAPAQHLPEDTELNQRLE